MFFYFNLHQLFTIYTTCCLIVIMALVSSAEDQFWNDITEERDMQLIRKDLPDFQRPDFKQIPYLIQRVNVDLVQTDYLLPPEEPGQTVAKVAFSRPTLDSHLSVLIFPTGYHAWSDPVDRKYVVLRRHSRQTPVYFLTYAYVRQSGNHRHIEWFVEELVNEAKKSHLDSELCRREECDLPEWILGTCSIISQKCSINITQEERAALQKKIKFEEEPDEVNKHVYSSDTSEEMVVKRSRRSIKSPVPYRHHRGLQLSQTNRRRRKIKSSLVTKPSSATNPSNLNSSLPNSYYLVIPLVKNDFKFRLKRAVIVEPTIEDIIHTLKCKNCRLLGNFFKDLEEDVDFNKILGIKFLQVHNNTKIKPNRRFPWMRPAKELPYIGYGDCTYMSLEPDWTKPLSSEMDDVIEFYLATLRLDCNTVLTNEIRGWLTSKLRFLRIVQDLSFELIPTSKLLRFKMLTPQEFDMLMSALLFLKYSAVYREDSMSKLPNGENNFDNKMSTKVSFLTKVIMKVVDLSNQHLKHHLIKTTRVLARKLKDKFYALILEHMWIKEKAEGKQVKLYKENYRDRIQIMALKEFLLYGLSPIFRSATSTDVAFSSFYSQNENRIRFLVHSYGFDGVYMPLKSSSNQ